MLKVVLWCVGTAEAAFRHLPEMTACSVCGSKTKLAVLVWPWVYVLDSACLLNDESGCFALQAQQQLHTVTFDKDDALAVVIIRLS